MGGSLCEAGIVHSHWHLACSLSLAAQVTDLKVCCAHAVEASMKGLMVTRPVAAGPVIRECAVPVIGLQLRRSRWFSTSSKVKEWLNGTSRG